MVKVHGLLVAGPVYKTALARYCGRESDEPPGAFGTVNQM